ncbi:MFS transporter [Nocardia sp. NPDC004722]
MTERTRTGRINGLLPDSRPLWVLSASNLSRAIATGFIASVCVLYFTKIVHISASEVGFGLSLAAVIAMVASIPAGYLADRAGARLTTSVFLLVEAAAVLGYTVVRTFWGLVVAVSVVATAESAARASRGALIANALDSTGRVRARAYLRAVSNLGMGLGTLFGAVVLTSSERVIYAWFLAATGLLFAAAGLVCLVLPRDEELGVGHAPSGLSALHDRTFLVFAGLNAMLAMSDGLLTFALPLWMEDRTDIPTSVYAVMLLLNSVAVVVFQVRASRGTDDVTGAARALRRSGILGALSCVIFALTQGLPVWTGVLLITVGVSVHVSGELLYSAGSWTLSYDLAPPGAQGVYQGVFSLSTQLGVAATPAVAAVLILNLGAAGWLVLAAPILIAGLLAPWLTSFNS